MQVSFFHYQLCPDIIASSGIGFVLRPANVFVRKRSANVATAKGFYLRESEAAAAKGFYLRESEAAAAKGFYLRESKAAAAKGFYLRESKAAAAKGFYLRESKAAAATTRCRSVSRYRMDAMVLG